MLLPGVCTNPDLRCDYNVQQLFNRWKLFKPKQSSPPNTTGTENGVEQVFNLTNTNTLLGTIKIAASYKEVMNSVFLFDSWVFQFQISKRTKNLRGGNISHEFPRYLSSLPRNWQSVCRTTTKSWTCWSTLAIVIPQKSQSLYLFSLTGDGSLNFRLLFSLSFPKWTGKGKELWNLGLF